MLYFLNLIQVNQCIYVQITKKLADNMTRDGVERCTVMQIHRIGVTAFNKYHLSCIYLHVLAEVCVKILPNENINSAHQLQQDCIQN